MENHGCTRDEVYVNSTKLSKISKYGKRQLIKILLFFIKNNDVKVHYVYHGYGEMDSY